MTTQILNVTPILTNHRQRQLGLIAALGTVAIWSMYFLSLRVGALSPLTSIDLAILRFAIPGLLLTTTFTRSIGSYRNTPWLYRFGIIFGGGLPFFLVSAKAMQTSGVLMGSTLIPGVAPLFVSLIALFLFNQQLPKKRIIGLFAIVSGVFALLTGAWLNANQGMFIGALLFIGCAFSWAIFTVSVRQSQLRPLQVAALAAVPNGAFIILYGLITQPTLTLLHIPMNQLVAQAVIQGLLVGICSGLFYSHAIARLGAEKTATIGSMTPIVSTLLAIIFLQEALEFMPALGLCLTAVGVFFASRAQTN